MEYASKMFFVNFCLGEDDSQIDLRFFVQIGWVESHQLSANGELVVWPPGPKPPIYH